MLVFSDAPQLQLCSAECYFTHRRGRPKKIQLLFLAVDGQDAIIKARQRAYQLIPREITSLVIWGYLVICPASDTYQLLRLPLLDLSVQDCKLLRALTNSQHEAVA